MFTKLSGEFPASVWIPKPKTAPYFTDASVLTPAFGNPPTIILGPGEAGKAHQTDEYCSVERIHRGDRHLCGFGQAVEPKLNRYDRYNLV